MKYEITKGAKEEFELAPEWATLVVAGRHYNKAWISHYANGARALAFGTKDEYVIEAIDDCEVIAERRPITEPGINKSSWRETAQVGIESVESAMKNNTQWDGEGLPPVGVECEIKYGRASNAEWIAFRCVGVDCGVAFGWAGNEAVVICKESYEFRPIPSPEDVARDEAVAKMVSILNEGTSTQDDARDIYDAIASGKIPGVKLE